MSRAGRPGPASRIARGDILKAARRYYDLGHSQSDIASDMGISPSYLARLLKSAKDAGWVRVFIDADRETELATRVKAAFPSLQHVEVVRSAESGMPTAEAIATAMAAWFNDHLDHDEALDEHRVWNVAIGGALPHRLLVDQIVPRRNRVSVGPTALTPSPVRVERHTAPHVAALLAHRLGALPAANEPGMSGPRRGFLFSPTLGRPPTAGVAALRTWHQALTADDDMQAMNAYWRGCDAFFVSSVSSGMLYKDVDSRLRALGVDPAELGHRGAVAMVANQFVNSQGEMVEIAPGVPSLEPVVTCDMLRACVARGGTVVLDRWGEGPVPSSLIASGICSVLFTDSQNADILLAR